MVGDRKRQFHGYWQLFLKQRQRIHVYLYPYPCDPLALLDQGAAEALQQGDPFALAEELPAVSPLNPI